MVIENIKYIIILYYIIHSCYQKNKINEINESARSKTLPEIQATQSVTF